MIARPRMEMIMPKGKQKARHIGNIDALPQNEDWLKVVARDVDTKGKPIPNRFDKGPRQRGETA